MKNTKENICALLEKMLQSDKKIRSNKENQIKDILSKCHSWDTVNCGENVSKIANEIAMLNANIDVIYQVMCLLTDESYFNDLWREWER